MNRGWRITQDMFGRPPHCIEFACRPELIASWTIMPPIPNDTGVFSGRFVVIPIEKLGSAKLSRMWFEFVSCEVNISATVDGARIPCPLFSNAESNLMISATVEKAPAPPLASFDGRAIMSLARLVKVFAAGSRIVNFAHRASSSGRVSKWKVVDSIFNGCHMLSFMNWPRLMPPFTRSTWGYNILLQNHDSFVWMLVDTDQGAYPVQGSAVLPGFSRFIHERSLRECFRLHFLLIQPVQFRIG